MGPRESAWSAARHGRQRATERIKGRRQAAGSCAPPWRTTVAHRTGYQPQDARPPCEGTAGSVTPSPPRVDIVQSSGEIQAMTDTNPASTVSARERMVAAAVQLVSAVPDTPTAGASSPSQAPGTPSPHTDGDTNGGTDSGTNSGTKRRRATRKEARGAEALGIRAVAEAAGVTHAAPLHHFPDRVCLLAAVAAYGQMALAQALDEARAAQVGGSARQLLGAVVQAHALWAARHPGLWDVMGNPQLTDDITAVWRGRTEGRSAEEVFANTSETARARARRAEAFDELVTAKVRVYQAYEAAAYSCPAEALRMELFPSGDRRPLVHALTCVADGLALQFIGERDVNEPALRAHVDATLNLLLAGVLR